MRQYGTKAGRVKWRALLIIGALISLCLSDTVGPRLLPLPTSELATTAEALGRPGPAPAASRTPPSSKSLGPRVDMAATSQNRAGADHKHMQVAAHSPRSVLQAPAGIILSTLNVFKPLYSLTAQVSRPPGRAPPRLV
jgi:hypothetical protein